LHAFCPSKYVWLMIAFSWWATTPGFCRDREIPRHLALLKKVGTDNSHCLGGAGCRA
jgi:hypothetical protein